MRNGFLGVQRYFQRLAKFDRHLSVHPGIDHEEIAIRPLRQKHHVSQLALWQLLAGSVDIAETNRPVLDRKKGAKRYCVGQFWLDAPNL